jgi:2-oxoglutarate ferredoxin oxidoreductase subunit alpha
MLMMDECVGHMIERVMIPPANEIQVFKRRMYHGPKNDFQLFGPEKDLVPPMVKAGEGYQIHVTGLTHDEKGYPSMTVATQAKLVTRLIDKLRVNADKIIDFREDGVEGADIVVVTYGITSRTAIPAIEQARKEGLHIGHLRLVTAWPFPEKRIRELASKVKTLVVPELNLGQMVHEVERLAGGKAATVHVPHAGGTVHNPKEIYAAIKKAVKG